MANDKNKSRSNSPRAPKSIKDLAGSIQTIVGDLYTRVYSTAKNDAYDLKTIQQSIDKSLDSIMQSNEDSIGKPNISSVYSRMINTGKMNPPAGTSTIDPKDFQQVFEDKELMDTAAGAYAANTWIKNYDEEIDLICKYMTKLEEAIEVKKDTVLFADQFNRDYLNVRPKSSISYPDSALNSEMALLKAKYDLQQLGEDVCYRAWKYGEDFLYIVPYQKAFQKILNNRKRYNYKVGQVGDGHGGSVTEAVSFEIESPSSNNLNSANSTSETMDFSFNVTFNTDCAFTESIERMCRAADRLTAMHESEISINAPIGVDVSVLNEVKSHNQDMTFGRRTKLSSKQIIPDDTVPGETEGFHPITGDGITDPNNISGSQTGLDEVVAKCPGCLVKRLERYRVIPIYIEDMCMGYYYVEVESPTTLETKSKFNTCLSFSNSAFRNRLSDMSDPVKMDSVINRVAAQLSKMIDAKFINANQDLSKELYMILKYDEKFNQNTNNIKITYIPPEDIEHVYFKMNPKTHRGVSLLDKAMIPAKIYISLSMSYAVGILTRGQDKRVYYVKQQVDTNISKVLLNAINQIKKGNFGARNMENLLNVLNITGQYNDYFIPRSASGDSPIDFEVLQGQEFDPKMEFLQQFEDYAIGTTGIPVELISSRQSVDYALQLTMTNSKHIRIVYKDQSKIQAILSRIITKIYNAEFNRRMSLDVILPPPMYIAMTNTSQLVTNALDYAEKVVEPAARAQGLDDNAVAIAKELYVRQTLGTYTNYDLIDEIIRKAQMQSKQPNPNQSEE